MLVCFGAGTVMFGPGTVIFPRYYGNVWSWNKAARLIDIEPLIIFCGGVSRVRCKILVRKIGFTSPS